MEYDRQRLDVEWTTLIAMREALGIAYKDKFSPTYALALALGRVLAPRLYDPEVSLLARSNESQTAREFRQRAEVLSELEGRSINPLELIDPEIEEFQRLNSADPEKEEIGKKLRQLYDARRYFTPKKYTETQLILHDLYNVKRGIPLPAHSKGRFKQYRLSKDRGLRIYLLHPDPPEHSMGADLIYETYWEKKKKARIAVIQYKICRGRAIYSSQTKNLEEQLQRMQEVFCESGLCDAWHDANSERRYRLPYCAAFLRPTDELQHPDSNLLSSGLHVPVCVAQRAWESTGRGGRKIEKAKIRSSAVTHKVFEELFNANILGSRWFSYEEIKRLYKEHQIFESNEQVLVHAQEFDA